MVAVVVLTLFGARVVDVSAQTVLVQDVFEQVESALPAELNIEEPPSVRLQDTAPAAAPDRPQGDASLPPPAVEGKLPLAGRRPGDGIEISQNAQGLISLVVRDRSLSEVLALLAEFQGLNIVASNSIDALITITLTDVPLEEALTAILSVANYTWVQRNGIILITSLTDSANLPADVQGRQIQVFELDFASAAELEKAVTNLITPGLGKVTISETDPADNRRTRELLVVEDLPEALSRIAAYIHQVDQPPRQVLIEAHVLQVTLTDETRCGVDWHALCEIAGSDVNIFSVPTLAEALPGSGVVEAPGAPAFLATFAGHDLQAVLEALQTTTDTKTLGSPKILVLNEQEARVHVGESIGYQTSTTTDVSISQAPQFLDVGVTLNLTPRITRDGRVLLKVIPEVSSGEFNPVSNAPDKRTTELETDVMLEDGQGMVIGGLIRESDSVTQSKVPYLGEVRGIGWLFRKSTIDKERVEIIFALVPRIQPYGAEYQAFEQGELVKAGVPLMHGPLHRNNRPWDPVLPDGKRVYRPIVPKFHRHHRGDYQLDSEYVVPPQPRPVQRFYGENYDPSWHGSGTHGPARPLLSDEAAELPPGFDGDPGAVEIITDQD
jgi:type II secretory pathway component GspD/PulD (secretin)